MNAVSINDASANLPGIISSLSPGEQLTIVDAGKPLATLTKSTHKQWPCTAGSAKNTPHWMAADFDAPLEDFRELME
jgi:antitoxin (DNA-binding transcriptional repressor) of toxin-antitoxin stability system